MNVDPPPKRVDFAQAPFLVIWETTRSCGLACRHCRAEAILGRDPGELTTAEAKSLIDQTADMGTPIFVLSGGDALMRPDLEELIAHGKGRGLRMATIPAATPLLTRERIQKLKDAGVDQLAFSIDGPNAELHDGFRGVKGSFAKTMEGIAFAHEAGIPLQINTVFAAWNYPHLDELVALVRSLGVVFWEVFFLIPMGRGSAMRSLTAEQFETVFDRMQRLSREESFIVKLTEGQHYRRFLAQNKRVQAAVAAAPAHPGARPPAHTPRGIGMSPQAVNSGKGFAFVDHRGNICPSGFLAIPAGNVRTHRLAEVYRGAPIFRELRDPKALKGKCGRCQFLSICGGSRARAYAVTGDYLASDPFCAYEP